MEPPEGNKRSVCSGGRVVNFVIAVIFLLIMITSLAVVGIIGGLTAELSKHPDKDYYPSAPCPLYVQCIERSSIPCALLYGGVTVCLYVEVSFGIIAFFALVYFVVQVVRAIFQFDIWFTAMIDLLLAFLAGLGWAAAAIAISIGQVYTCSKVHEHYNYYDWLAAATCNQKIPDLDGIGDPETSTGVFYYDLVNASLGAAWICSLFVFSIFVTMIVRVVIFWRRRKAESVLVNMEDNVTLTAADELDDKPE